MINTETTQRPCITCGIEGPLDKDNKCSICGELDNN
jgi:hypothetical protein